MRANISLLMAVTEQAGVPVLPVAFTLAAVTFIFSCIFIFRRRHHFFNRDPNVENDGAAFRHNREEIIIIVSSILMLILVGILHQVRSA